MNTSDSAAMAMPDDGSISLSELGRLLRRQARRIAVVTLAGGVAGFAASYLVAPVFTARTSFLPPQQQQSASAATLSQLGSLFGMGAGLGGIKSPAEQYASLMQSVTASDRIIDKFDLMKVYDVRYRFEARKELAGNVRITLGKKDGLISVEVDDRSPPRAAAMANQYVEELRRMSNELALTEAQQRRVFFEGQLKSTRDKLTQAQRALQDSGFSAGALKAEPKAAAEAYARLNAELTAAEVRLQTLRRSLADNAPEIQHQQGLVAALREQLARAAVPAQGTRGDPDYIGRYREYKYQETLFELFARQFELARVDESREGGLIQVVDKALEPEWKSRPKRAQWAVSAALATLLLAAALVALRASRAQARRSAG